MVAVVKDIPEIPDWERKTPYNCKVLGHIFERRWAPSSQSEVRRSCVIPGCHYTQTKKVSGA
jgi:hypothetical protein